MIPTNAAVDNSQFAKMAEGIVRLKKVLYLYCPPRSKICAVKPALRVAANRYRQPHPTNRADIN
jgi:hypothetical protein